MYQICTQNTSSLFWGHFGHHHHRRRRCRRRRCPPPHHHHHHHHHHPDPDYHVGHVP